MSHSAVVKAVHSGRLSRSVGKDGKGRPVIADPELAIQEWRDNAVQERRPVSLIEEQRGVIQERQRKLKLSNDAAEGRLVDKRAVEAAQFEVTRIIRENILNVPARLAGELAAETETAKVHRVLEQALRQALNATADALEAAAVNHA